MNRKLIVYLIIIYCFIGALIYVKFSNKKQPVLQQFSSSSRQTKCSLADSPWPKFRGDARNSGLSIGSGARGKIKWVFQAKGRIDGSVAIGKNNTLYFSSSDGNMYAVDTKTGKEKWRFNGKFDSSTPAISNTGIVYNCSPDSYLYALNAVTGKLIWKFKAGESNRYSPAIGSNNRIYFTSEDCMLYAMDGRSGKKLWGERLPVKIPGTNAAISSRMQSDIAIGRDNIIYASSNAGVLHAIDGKTGLEIWHYNAKGRISSPSIGLDGKVYVASSLDKSNIRICALNGKNGSLKWNTAFKGTTNTFPAVGCDGSVFVGVGENPGRLYALDGATGKPKWKFEVGVCQPAFSVASDGTVYVSGGDWDHGKLYAVDGKSGHKKWELNIDSGMGCSPAIDSDGTIYIGSFTGKLYAIK